MLVLLAQMCSAQLMGCDSYPVRDVLEMIRKRDHIQGNTSTCLSFWRKFHFFFHDLLRQNLKTMEKKIKHELDFVIPSYQFTPQ